MKKLLIFFTFFVFLQSYSMNVVLSIHGDNISDMVMEQFKSTINETTIIQGTGIPDLNNVHITIFLPKTQKGTFVFKKGDTELFNIKYVPLYSWDPIVLLDTAHWQIKKQQYNPICTVRAWEIEIIEKMNNVVQSNSIETFNE